MMTYNNTNNATASISRRKREDAQNIISAWRNTIPTRNVYTYDGDYIMSNTVLIDDIVNRCAYNRCGDRFLIEAPPGSGKTAFICKYLPDKTSAKTDNRKTIILAIPNNITAWQCHEDYGTIVIAGDSDDTINLNSKLDRNVYTVVYECIGSLMTQATAADLSNVVLVIDEAHQLITECSYRAFNKIIDVAYAIVDAGGVVICMTATPRSILCLWQYSTWIAAVRKDGRKTNIENIDYTVIAKGVKVQDAILEEARTANKTGCMPIIRYQSKKMIDNAREVLESEGLRVGVLTADSKLKIRDKEGKINYDSPVFEGIIKDGVLPDVDVVMCTSVIEVGTSIKGIMRGGHIDKDSTIIPIFVCNRGKTDVDKMIQFFARFRFKVDNAKVMVCNCQHPSEHPVDLTVGADSLIQNFATSIYMQRSIVAEAFTNNIYRRFLVSWHGHIDGAGLTSDYNVDVALVWADAIQRYYGLIYRQKGAAEVILGAEFGVPVHIVPVEDAKKNGKVSKKTAISDITKDAFRKLLKDDVVVLAIASCGHDKKISEFVRYYTEGKKLIEAVRTYMAAEWKLDDTIPHDKAVEAAIYAVENPGGRYFDPETKCEINTDIATDTVYLAMASWPQDVAMLVLDNYAGLHPIPAGGYTNVVLACKPDILDVMDGQKWRDFLDVYRIFRALDVKARYDKMRGMMRFFAYHSRKECRTMRYEYTMIHLNRCANNIGNAYGANVCPESSYIISEHLVLTHPERYLYEAKISKNGKIDRRYTGKAWFSSGKRGTFVGHILTSDDIKTIAKGMGASITRLAGKGGIVGDYYSANDVFLMLRCAYSHTFLTEGKDTTICASFKDMDDRKLRMRIRGYRYNAPKPIDAIMSDEQMQAQQMLVPAPVQAQKNMKI